jgi:hypothetical protein
MDGTQISKRPTDEPGAGSRWPLIAWGVAALGLGAVVLTELVVGTVGGELVIDWKIGPAFVGLIGAVWGARRARQRLLAAEAAEALLLAEEEAQELMEMRAVQTLPPAPEETGQ